MLKRLFEQYLLAARWLLAPFLVMMTFGLLALIVKAAKKTYGLLTLLFNGQDEYLTLQVLNLIDLSLTAALVMIVAVSVYENFIARMSREDLGVWPEGMNAVDFSQLKLKLLSTIVAISAIKLLEAFVDAPEVSDRDLNYYIIVHLTFVASTLAFAISERVSGHSAPHGDAAKDGD